MKRNFAIEILKREEHMLETWGDLHDCGMTDTESKLKKLRQAIADLEKKEAQREMRKDGE